MLIVRSIILLTTIQLLNKTHGNMCFSCTKIRPPKRSINRKPEQTSFAQCRYCKRISFSTCNDDTLSKTNCQLPIQENLKVPWTNLFVL